MVKFSETIVVVLQKYCYLLILLRSEQPEKVFRTNIKIVKPTDSPFHSESNKAKRCSRIGVF